jgi:hypothetical protein
MYPGFLQSSVSDPCLGDEYTGSRDSDVSILLPWHVYLMLVKLHVRRAGLLAARSLVRQTSAWLLQVCLAYKYAVHVAKHPLSTTMHGTLLDQRVFESLVARCLPMISDHFQEVDVQLSVASLPWFLSL